MSTGISSFAWTIVVDTFEATSCSAGSDETTARRRLCTSGDGGGSSISGSAGAAAAAALSSLGRLVGRLSATLPNLAPAAASCLAASGASLCRLHLNASKTARQRSTAQRQNSQSTSTLSNVLAQSNFHRCLQAALIVLAPRPRPTGWAAAGRAGPAAPRPLALG